MNIFKQHFKIKLPCQIDLDQILLEYPIQVTIHKNNPLRIRDRAAFILGQIMNAHFNPQREFDKKGFTALSSVILQSTIKNYKQYLDYFVDIGVIRTNGGYSNFKGRERSRGFKFVEKIDTTEYYDYFIYDHHFLNTIFSIQRPKSVRSKYNYLYKWFTEIEIPIDKAMDILGDDNKYQQQLVENIADPFFYKLKQGKTNRLFTHITQLKKQLRQLIQFRGVETIEIDIKNSIPYFSLLLFDNVRLKKDPIINKILHTSNPTILDEFDCKLNSTIGEGIILDSYLWLGSSQIMLGETDPLEESYDDITKFRNGVLDGNIYTQLADLWKEHTGLDHSRKKAKHHLLTILNCPPHYDSKEKKILTAEFPNVMRVYDRLNENYFTTNRGKRTKKYSNSLACPFAYFTQMMEAHFILDLVCSRIANEYPECPMYTVHDSIGTIPEYEDTVVKIIQEESERWLGFPLKLETTSNKILI